MLSQKWRKLCNVVIANIPTLARDDNLLMLADMLNTFDFEVSLSDHTLDKTSDIVSVTLSARVVEKLVILEHDDGGTDNSFSL